MFGRTAHGVRQWLPGLVAQRALSVYRSDNQHAAMQRSCVNDNSRFRSGMQRSRTKANQNRLWAALASICS